MSETDNILQLLKYKQKKWFSILMKHWNYLQEMPYYQGVGWARARLLICVPSRHHHANIWPNLQSLTFGHKDREKYTNRQSDRLSGSSSLLLSIHTFIQIHFVDLNSEYKSVGIPSQLPPPQCHNVMSHIWPCLSGL